MFVVKEKYRNKGTVVIIHSAEFPEKKKSINLDLCDSSDLAILFKFNKEYVSEIKPVLYGSKKKAKEFDDRSGDKHSI